MRLIAGLLFFYGLLAIQPICAQTLALTCSEAFSVQNQPHASLGSLSGDRPFDVQDIDDVTLLTKKHAASLKSSGIAAFFEGVHDPRVVTQVSVRQARHFLDRLWARMKEVAGQDVLLSQDLIFGPIFFVKAKKGDAKPNPEQARYLENIKSMIQSWRAMNDSAWIDKSNLNRTAFAASMVMAHIQGKTKPRLDGLYRAGRFQGPDFSIIQELAQGYPSFTGFHPETTLWLISRGRYVWKVGTELRAVDGQTDLDPHGDSYHERGHHENLLNANRDVSVEESSKVFDRLWAEYMNRPGQTWRDRELAIHVVFISFFESGRPFTFHCLREDLMAFKDSAYFIDRYVKELNSEHYYGSRLLHQRQVTETEFLSSIEQLLKWLG